MSVREEVRHAREVAEVDDPGWARLFWPIWLAAVALSFAIAETVALVRPGEAKRRTLSARTRVWLGIDPPRARRRWGAVGFLVALLVFAVWFGPHIVWGIW